MKSIYPILSAVLCLFFASACSVSLSQKEKPATTWRLVPDVTITDKTENTKDIALIIAKPWVSSGFDSSHVIVSTPEGELDMLSNVKWADVHSEWLRNYFLEGLQSSGLFSSVTANYKLRSQHWVVQLHLWDLSVHYNDYTKRGSPLVKAKLTYTISDGLGNKLIDQTTIQVLEPVSENRLVPIMSAFESVVSQCYQRVYSKLQQL
ncbi:MAG: ABC-type transport auxiliary lipoprotein family protein [Pseudomonadales bacterium]|nr:ABC-type transport auxiliary lipoprotein family protein [Pseudomonadales bacterium]